ncbi:carbohydrate ABC transporter permease [Ruania alba]|uniref:Carbohydrate ABC transporter membrane protein 2, CUT1 family n=1 Tax=Ruania alba TaxID=648782 RepID=A0A1H5DDS4_9MICO|nr:carbohydrate ABC transporter permease [Ruania alba]SED76987.1 carbohydrate ABC transporter membrane protein 2, CUT1 family [Ruania alba]
MSTSTPTTTTRPAPAAIGNRPRSAAQKGRSARFHLLLVVAAITWLLPMIWMASMALTPNEVLQRSSTSLFPQSLTFENFLTVLRGSDMPRWFLNSAVVSIVTTVVTVVFCAMAGYAFARIPFPRRRIVFVIVLAGLMVPKEAMFVPLFLMISSLDWQNTYAALILPRLAAPLGVFLMTQFFSKVPPELEEAARIDGAGRWRTFFAVMLPLARPAMASLAIFTFVLTWNDYIWPLVASTRPEWFTITTGLASLQSNFASATNLGDLMARGLVGSLPLIVVFIVFQKQLIRGITLGSGEK